MDKVIKQYFNVDKKFTAIIFYPPSDDYIITIKIDEFKELFAEPLQKALDQDTNPIDEIRTFDPENKLGYNNLL
ncbi:hypothetical protein J2Z69_000785 [Paenibacillus shirakamiensis]|uniref:Uncharacterized protein n=1 Tax=Paenibacillus shirakamiensis TaxID=1265935 RepID=A0ABS4JFM2_9BACL|nr:hypothetical protein [Paenibacillus shirakamiensis]MBP1999766.1 hypothetical protein [Paenibacillus shirakamiensis]